jgi:apolipoprotein N-acyltransferase
MSCCSTIPLNAASAPRAKWFAVRGFLAAGALLGGATLAAAFPPWNLAFLAWVALVPLAYQATRPGTRHVILWSYMSGLVFYLSSLAFFAKALAGAQNLGPFVPLWLATVILASLSWPIAIALLRYLVTSSAWPCAFALPVAWVAGEFSEYLLFYPLDGNGFPFAQLGQTQIEVALVPQIADLGGVPVVSFVVAMVNGLVVDFLRLRGQRMAMRPFVRTWIVSTLLLVAALLYGYRQTPPTGPPGPTVLIHARSLFAGESAWRKLAERVPPAVDLVVFGELSYPDTLVDEHMASAETSNGRNDLSIAGFDPTLDASNREFLERQADRLHASVVVGCRHACRDQGDWRMYNAAAFVHEGLGYQGAYHKTHLAAGADFLPYHLELSGLIPPELPFLAVQRRRPSSWSAPLGFDRGREFPVFTLRRKDAHFTFGSVVCYDSAFPDTFRAFYGDSRIPDFFTVSALEALDTTGISQQVFLNLARFRAIECRRAVVRCADGGVSCLIDSLGRIVFSDRYDDGNPLLVGAVPLDNRISLYTMCGDVPMISLLMAAVLLPLALNVWKVTPPTLP